MAVELGTKERIDFLKKFDPEIAELLESEAEKQKRTIVESVGRVDDTGTPLYIIIDLFDFGIRQVKSVKQMK